MMGRRGDVFLTLAVLLASILAGVAGVRCEGSATVVSGELDALESVDFGDGPRIPLARVAARVGVIVIVTGERANIVRRDGTEVRLHVTPCDAAMDEIRGSPLVLKWSEVWARTKDLPWLLGSESATLDENGALTAAGRPASGWMRFEEFSVPKPVVSRDTNEPKSHRGRPIGQLKRIGCDDENGEAVSVGVSASEVDLAVTRTATFSTPKMLGCYQERTSSSPGLASKWDRVLIRGLPVIQSVEHLSLSIMDEDISYEVGDLLDPLFDRATGVGFSSKFADIKIGARALVPDGGIEKDNRGQLSVRASALWGGHVDADVALGSDGSCFASGKWGGDGMSLRLSAASRPDLRKQEMSWGQDLTKSLRGFAQRAELVGTHEARMDVLGLQWRMKRGYASVERVRGEAGGEAWGSDGLTLLALRGRTSGLVRYVVPVQPTGRKGFEWFYSWFNSKGQQVFAGSTAPAGGELGRGRCFRVGGSVPLRRGVTLRASVEGGSEGIRPEGRVEWRPSPEKVMMLRYGLLGSGVSESCVERGIVLQAQVSFGSTGRAPRGTGRVVGMVRNDIGRGVRGVMVTLDGETMAVTRADGSYAFEGVDPGRHVLAVKRERLHAGLGGMLPTRVVYVRGDGTEVVEFSVTRLCRIEGGVFVRESGDAREALTGAIVQLSTGEVAMTNSKGRYVFEGLDPGRYVVSLVSMEDANKLDPLGPTSWTVTLTPGDRIEEADFTFEQRQRPIVFEAIDVCG